MLLTQIIPAFLISRLFDADISDAEIDELFEKLDTDKSGGLDFHEVMKVCNY